MATIGVWPLTIQKLPIGEQAANLRSLSVALPNVRIYWVPRAGTQFMRCDAAAAYCVRNVFEGMCFNMKQLLIMKSQPWRTPPQHVLGRAGRWLRPFIGGSYTRKTSVRHYYSAIIILYGADLALSRSLSHTFSPQHVCWRHLTT